MKKEEIIKQLENEGWTLEFNAEYESFQSCIVAKKDNLVKTLEFYEDGTMKREYNYKDDKLDGLSKWFLPNGDLECERLMKDGRPV